MMKLFKRERAAEPRPGENGATEAGKASTDAAGAGTAEESAALPQQRGVIPNAGEAQVETPLAAATAAQISTGSASTGQATAVQASPGSPGTPVPGNVGRASHAAATTHPAPASSSEARATAIRSALRGSTSADFEPLVGLIGLDHARELVKSLRRAESRSCAFIMVPRTASHAEALRTLLAEEAAALPAGDAVVVVARFEGTTGLRVLCLPALEARELADGVTAAVTMLSSTVPAAFESDSYRVARIALDEELRSGHDGALDALRRKAQAQNIGLIRTTNGYAVVPMHDGRVVRGEIYGALPGSLKTDVEAKLAAFEAELTEILKARALLQQDHHRRAKELERDAASLAVDAATRQLFVKFQQRNETAAWLEALRDDLVTNALLFVAAHREAGGVPRAPAEIAQDPRLQRYRVNVLSRGGRGLSGLEQPDTLDRSELNGIVLAGQPISVAPDAVSAGALTRPGGGLVLIDARDLMANYAGWPLVKHALRAARAAPVTIGEGGVVRAATLDLPVDVRVVVTGETDEFKAWSRLDGDVARMVRVVDAFQAALPLTADNLRLVARHLAGFVRADGILPFDGPALAAVFSTLETERDGDPAISTDLDPARDVMSLASASAHKAGRLMVLADDVADVLRSRQVAAPRRSQGTP